MKRFIAFVVALSMIMALVSVPVSAESAAAPVTRDTSNMLATFTAGAPETVAKGEEFEVTLSISGNYQAHGIAVRLNYDTETFEYVSYEPGPVYNAAPPITYFEQGTTFVSFGFMNMTDTPLSAEGVIYTATFKAKDDAQAGTYAFTPEITSNGNFVYMPSGSTGEPIPHAEVAANVEIVEDSTADDPTANMNATFLVESPETAIPGEDIQVTLNVSGEYQMTGLQIDLTYDPDVFEITAYTPGAIIDAVTAAGGFPIESHSVPGRVSLIVLIYDGDISDEGVIYTLDMHVADDAEPGVYPFTIDVVSFIYSEPGTTDVYNIENVTTEDSETEILELFTVTWVNWDGTELEVDEDVPYGETPSYDGEEPTKEGDAQYSYNFIGWDPEISEVEGDITYTAVFEEVVNTYTVTWVNWDGTELEVDEDVPYGETPSYDGEEPTKEGDAQYSYNFIGWDPEISEVEGDITYTAVFEAVVNTYTVTFIFGYDLSLTETVEVPYGSAATAPELPEYFWYIFTGWDTDFSNVTEDITVTAQYYELGDADQDGDVDMADALLVLRYCMGVVEDVDTTNMDIDGDGEITMMDGLLIQRHVMGLLSPNMGW